MAKKADFRISRAKNEINFPLYLNNDKFHVEGLTSSMSQSLGKVNMTEQLQWRGEILSATISYRAGWWFVSISVEVEHTPPPHSGGTVGIDLGLKTLATTSDGVVFENQKHNRGAWDASKA